MTPRLVSPSASRRDFLRLIPICVSGLSDTASGAWIGIGGAGGGGLAGLLAVQAGEQTTHKSTLHAGSLVEAIYAAVSEGIPAPIALS